MNTMCALFRRKTLLSWCSLCVVPCRGRANILKSYFTKFEEYMFLTYEKIFVIFEVLLLAIKLQRYVSFRLLLSTIHSQRSQYWVSIAPNDIVKRITKRIGYTQREFLYLKLVYFNCSKMYSLTLSIQVSEGKYTPQRISIVMVIELGIVHVKTRIAFWIVTFCEEGASKCVKLYCKAHCEKGETPSPNAFFSLCT